jgi:p-methyltransferase
MIESAPYDLVIVGKWEMIDYASYQHLPLERVDLFQDLVQMRMVYYDGGFRPFFELMNHLVHGRYFSDSSFAQRRQMFSIWNMASLNPLLAVGPMLDAGFRVGIIQNLDSEFDRLEAMLEGQDQPLVALSTTFVLNWSTLGRAVKRIRARFPKVRFVVGGAFINDQYKIQGKNSLEAPLRKLGIGHALVAFNSEYDFLDLMRAFKQGGDLAAVNNLAYFDARGAYQVTAEAWQDPGLGVDCVPWESIELPEGSDLVQLRSASGCAFRCSFCSYPVSAGGYHTGELDALKGQLDKIAARGIKTLIFIDDTFNVPDKRFRQILEILKQFKFRWYSFFRVQFATEEIVQAMKESGCDGVYLGIESANGEVLKNMNKKATPEEYRRGLALLKAQDIATFAAFIIGFPGETSESVDDNIRFVEEGNIDFYGLKEFYYLHNSTIHQRAADFGLVGEGAEWSHQTMDNIKASQEKLRMYDTIKRSSYIDADMGLWYLAYLRTWGFSWPALRRLQEVLNAMVRRDNEGRYEDKQDLIEALRQLLAQTAPKLDV